MKHLKSPIATGFSSGHKEFSNKCTFCLDEMLPKGSIVAEGTPLELKNEYVHDTISLYGVTEDEIKALKTEYKEIRDGYRIQVKNTLEATKMIVKHQEIFRDYEVVKGGMDDVFLAVTGKILGGGQ